LDANLVHVQLYLPHPKSWVPFTDSSLHIQFEMSVRVLFSRTVKTISISGQVFGMLLSGDSRINRLCLTPTSQAQLEYHVY
jgi:hypothetical protein